MVSPNIILGNPNYTSLDTDQFGIQIRPEVESPTACSSVSDYQIKIVIINQSVRDISCYIHSLKQYFKKGAFVEISNDDMYISHAM